MSILKKTLNGAAWSTSSGVIQVVVSLATFAFVAARLTPSEIGAFGVVMLAIGLAETLVAAPLTESLQQRENLERRHINATFWISLGLSILAACILVILANPIAHVFKAPDAAPLFVCAVLLIPLASVLGVLYSLLARDLKFDQVARASAVTTILSGIITISALLAGAGIWSLLISDLSARLFKALWFWKLCRFIPDAPRDLGAFKDLAKFNTNTVLTYLLGYADGATPRILTGLLLGAAPLGYLIVAQRVLGMITQLVLSPLATVTMAAVARLQANRDELQRLIMTLYTIAAVVGYPAFLGAVLIVPDLAALLGDKWVAAILPTQILLFIGLRTTTGMFNIAILRGVGRSGVPLILLGVGFLLNLLIVPTLSIFGVVGVSVALLLRTYATWPLGLWFVKGATGLSVLTQARAGIMALVAASMMAIIVAIVLHITPALSSVERLGLSLCIGLASYSALLTIIMRIDILTVAHKLRNGEPMAAAYLIAGRFNILEARS